MSDTDREEELRRFTELRRTNAPVLRGELIEGYLWLAHHCARRFAGKGEARDDLEQVASVALVHAVDRFDPSFGVRFSTFAVPTMMGEGPTRCGAVDPVYPRVSVVGSPTPEEPMAPPQDFGLEVEPGASTVTVHVRGEVDMSSAKELVESLSAAGTPGVTVVADLSKVTFIDSSALAALITSARLMASAGSRLEIGPRSDVVARLFEITGLTDGTADFVVRADANGDAVG